MRAVVQRVSEANVLIQNESVGRIGRGLLVFLGIAKNDTPRDIDWMADKIVNLRIFETQEGKMDESLLDIGGDLLIVSQFTLYGDCRKGRRPSFSDAMEAGAAKSFFELFVKKAKEKVTNVQTGVFQAMMQVSLTNDGPVTILLDSTQAQTHLLHLYKQYKYGIGIMPGALIRAIDRIGYEKDEVVLVSGIGCSGRLPVYVDNGPWPALMTLAMVCGRIQ